MEADNISVRDLVESDEGEETKYVSGIKLALVTVALCLAVFLLAFDNTVIGVKIPKITYQIHYLNDVGWYGSAYLATTW